MDSMVFFALQRDRCKASSYEVEAMKLFSYSWCWELSRGASVDVTICATKRIDRCTAAHSAA
jgi:hypothetical protein